MMLKRGLRGHEKSRRGEGGQAAVLFALMLVALLGVTGLVIDGSNTQENRRQLQNGADAAALAGAEDLPGNTTQATTDAKQWLTLNPDGDNLTGATVSFSTTSTTNDTITVSLQRTINYSFSRVLGLTSGNVGASATVKVGGAGAACAPAFAIWYRVGTVGASLNNNPTLKGQAVQVGQYVEFRASANGNNTWATDNTDAPNGLDWTGAADSGFVGFLNPGNNAPSGGCQYGGITSIGTNETVSTNGSDCNSGGSNSGEKTFIQAMNTAYNATQPDIIIVAVMDRETDVNGGGSGSELLHIHAFAPVDINVSLNKMPLTCNGGTKSIYGKVVRLDSTLYGLQPGGGACSGISVCIPQIIR